MQVECFVEPDGSLIVDYQITFENSTAGRPIDIVDIGLPQRGYHTLSGSVDGHRIDTIRDSEVVAVGVELHLAGNAIMPGETGTVHFRGTLPKMVYADTTNDQYASLQFLPTWYDPPYRSGQTHLQAAIHLPPGVKMEQVRYQSEATKYTDLRLFGEGDETHVVARWDVPDHTLSSNNPKFSLSFPRDVMTSVVTVSRFQMAVRWLENNTQVQFVSGGLLAAMLAFLFFRFSHGTGCVVFVILLFGLIVVLVAIPGLHFLAWPGMLGLVGLNEVALRKRKKNVKEYLPAMATVEGGGIKRGLTAPQAAVLLELPLGKVLALVVFGLLKKRVLSMVAENPLQVEVDPTYAVDAKERRRIAAKAGTVIHDYEHPFLDALAKHSGPVEKCELGSCMNELINSVVKRMAGFDVKSTRDYYKKIVSRAWTEAESIGDIQQKEKAIERNFDWMMMDPDWYDIWRGRGYTYRPVWTWPRHIPHSGGGGWASQIPTTGTGGTGGSSGGGSGASPVNPSLGEVAAGFAGWMETSAGQLASAIDPTALAGAKVPQGFMDLSGVDRLTSDVFEALAKNSSSGGRGGGGGCACACAGCACACACAGGGR
jgi:uncharacterized membrane protein YgcG